MERADTILMRRMDEGAIARGAPIPEGRRVLTVSRANGRAEEYRPGMTIPPGAALTADVYEVSLKTYEPAFAVLDAITCLKPDGSTFRPGFCFTCRLRYITPMGAGELLRARRSETGRMPDAVTLEELYAVIRRRARALCGKAAEDFSGGKLLPYAHWWQELTDGTAYAASIERALLPLFNSCGFRLELGSLRISGVAAIPLD